MKRKPVTAILLVPTLAFTMTVGTPFSVSAECMESPPSELQGIDETAVPIREETGTLSLENSQEEGSQLKEETATESQTQTDQPQQVTETPAQNQILTVPETDKAVQSVQNQINTLPTDIELASMSLEEQQTVYEQVQAAYDAYNALTDEQKEQITGSEIFNELFAVFNGMVNALATAGDFTVNGGSSSDYSYSNGVLTINTSTALNISTSSQTTDRIAIASGVHANITLNGVNINAPMNTSAIDVPSGASLTLTLADSSTNTLSVTQVTGNGNYTNHAGIHVPSGASLTIQCASAASNGVHQCEENSNCGTLSVTGGYCQNGCAGAGIGGNLNESAGYIQICGGKVTATGGSTGSGTGGAGIGGGSSYEGSGGSGGTITITGGVVTATGGGGTTGRSAVGIGGGNSVVLGGNGGEGGTIIILTKSVTAAVGQTTAGSSPDSAIGGGLGQSTTASKGSGIEPDGDGNYQVYGNLELPGDIEIPNGVTVTIPSGTSLTNPSNMTLTINGTLNVVGTLINNGTITGSGKITPESAKFSASITGISVNKTVYDGKPVQDNEVRYKYTGDSSASISLSWYDDSNGTVGSRLSSAPSDPGTYWVQVSAESTGFYQAVSGGNCRFTIAKGQPSQPAAPTVSSKNANSITINTVSGQNYMYTTTATAPEKNDDGWVTATGATLTFDKLSSNTSIYIWTYAPENDYYFSSSVSSALSASTSEATYTVTIPADPSKSMIAGTVSSTATISVDSQTFNIGYGGEVSVSADKSVTLTRMGDLNTTITSALLVDDTKHTGGVFIRFNQSNYLIENKTIRFDQPVMEGGGTIPAGSYTGTMTFTISYSETESSN